MRISTSISALISLVALFGCAHVTNDGQALCSHEANCVYDPSSGYRFDPAKLKSKSDLVVLTFSGGGLRATALAYGTILALEELPSRDKTKKTLLDDVDIISSVSGGSVTAGWYALHGRDGLKDNSLETFIDKGAQGQLIAEGLNPVAIAQYVFTPRQSSDVLADVFAQDLYGNVTYAQVDQQYQDRKIPFVILNATDAGHETRFPFTQNRFDLICSDLSRYRLADAVAASADFPPVFSAMGIHNYSDSCPISQQSAWQDRGPLHWIEPLLNPNRDIVTNELLEIRAAREARDYLCPRGSDPSSAPEAFDPKTCNSAIIPSPSDGHTLHLQDGGVADNLGIQSVLSLEDDPLHRPGLYQRLGDLDPRYEDVQRVLFIVVNARSRDNAVIDKDVVPPGLFGTLLRIVDASLDATILTTQDYLTAELEAINERRSGCSIEAGPTARPAPATQTSSQINPMAGHAASNENCPNSFQIRRSEGRPALDIKIASVDFDMLDDDRCRRAFASLPTNWQLSKNAVQALKRLPHLLLTHSKDLSEYLGVPYSPPTQEEYTDVCDPAEHAQ